MTNFEYGNTLYLTESARNTAAAYDWATGGGLNDLCFARKVLSDKTLFEREIEILRREDSGWAEMVTDGAEEALEEIEENIKQQ